MKFAGHFVDLGEKKDFKWKEFHEAIDNYTGDELTFDKFQENHINQSQSTVDTMVEKITGFLMASLKVVLTEEEKTALRKNVETTFLDIKTISQTGFSSWSSHGSNSSWEYRLLFAFSDKRAPDDFYALVTTLRLTADISNEASWFGLSKSSSNNFGCDISAMRLVVTKGFKDPGKSD
jgi:hypothetical protein